MAEVKLCPLVAVQYIQLCKVDDARFHSVFQDINRQYDRFTQASLDIENRMNYYKTADGDCSGFPLIHNRFFKRSKDRDIKEQEFLAINVHLQKFTVNEKIYWTTSCGAAAAHTRGFRENGLWHMLGVSRLDTTEEFGCKMICPAYERHCKARTAIVNLKDSWGDVTSGLQSMREGAGVIEVFISQCQVLLHNIRQSISSEVDEGLVQEVKEATLKCVGHLRSSQETPDIQVFLTEAKTNLFSAYSKCLEFLVFRAMPVILSDDVQQRLDNVSSHILTIAVASILAVIATSPSSRLKDLPRTGLILNFESLLSESGKEFGMLSDYGFGVHFFLEHVRFVLTSESSELLIEGDRQSPRVYIPVSADILKSRASLVFSVTPVMFNIGINERQELQDIRNKPSPLLNAINSYSLNRLFHWIDNHAAERNILLNGYFLQLAEEVHLLEILRKKKNMEIHRLAAELTRTLSGGRIVNCKSGKDRTGMAITLEQARFLKEELKIGDGLFKQCLDDMRMHGVRRDNCKKNQDKYLYAFQKVQLMTFPKDYVPPKGSYGHAET